MRRNKNERTRKNLRIAETRDIWQNDLLYALCEGERILLTARLKELRRKAKIADEENKNG